MKAIVDMTKPNPSLSIYDKYHNMCKAVKFGCFSINALQYIQYLGGRHSVTKLDRTLLGHE